MSETIDLRPTNGAALIGIFISTAMYGFTTFQMFNYYQLSWHIDSWWIKVFVFYIWSLETVHVFLLCDFVYRFAIADFGNIVAISVTHTADDVTTGITALIVLSVHLFYTRRLWILSNKSVILVGVVGLLAFAHFGLEMAVMALTFKFPDFSQFHKITAFSTYTASLALAAGDDIIIAVSLCYLLYTRRTGVRKTDTLVNRIIAYTITTGALTSVVDIACLLCFVALPNALIYLALYDIAPNLYANSLLAMLNARESLQKASEVSTATGSLFALSELRARARTAIDNDGQHRAQDGPDVVSSKIAFAYPPGTESGLVDTVLDA